ncbi:uncharacterized protein LOC18030024 isoform X1 [Eutrema salsugineum]|uniref:uncharacterized protein LOC18030024 isoform X1 n=1 Tax=Eutrema salsugineum TaxID=72664 RepID=UPI000CED1D8B|nr:uncharacterized protein LOC18030024 isoform X1 [Eutrema salsugineum]
MEASRTRSEKKKLERENSNSQKNKKLPSVWFSLKKSLYCKSDPSDVHDPRSRKELATISTKSTTYRSGCSRSIANLKDVIHGSNRHLEKPPCSSPRSIGSSEFLNPITHEVILSNSTSELKITGAGDISSPTGAREFLGTLRPGTPLNYSCSYRSHTSRKASLAVLERDREGLVIHPSRRASLERDSAINGGSSSVSCHKCGEKFSKLEAAEAHHLTKHAGNYHINNISISSSDFTITLQSFLLSVKISPKFPTLGYRVVSLSKYLNLPEFSVTELVDGDSSRKIVEIICRTSWSKSENQGERIDRILKVHNMHKTLARFEEYRDTVKSRASKLQKKHPRCIADGNELLRFHGTTVACVLGVNGSTSLCSSEKCCVCRIIRNGFSAKREMNNGIGVFTASTSGRAFESIAIAGDEGKTERKALIVCRVIAGRVHRPVENVEETGWLNGFDSLAGKVGLYTNVEELYLLNSRALLPCFVVICKP